VEVLREGVLLVGIGSVVGLAAALVASRYLKRLLYDVSASDLGTYAAVLGAIGIAAMIAAWVPARRAASVDPMVALRTD
jgi:ABC-type antimicrobial peptide transport system permease subunit